MKIRATASSLLRLVALGLGAALGAFIPRNLPASPGAAGAWETVTVSVSDAQTRAPVPARITITDAQDELFKFRRSNRAPDTAMRRGVVYTRGTPTALELPPGTYHLYATRGMEWSRAAEKIFVRPGRPLAVKLTLRREVDTTGFIAADTHVHTLTFSGHGDASIEERMLTLAGEGVEMAVATDHNHNTDYRPYQRQMQVTDYFTPVTGNEVTTPVGHMNAFPLDPRADPPQHKLHNWVKLVDGIRAKGARVVILNHPRWPNLARSPLTTFGLNRRSGEFRGREPFPFDAMELANAQAPQPDPLYVVNDWFALLNRGYKITGAGASDSHTVFDPPGQARSYVPSRTDDPAQLDVDEACGHFVRGETSVSLGIFADVWVDGRHKMGHTNTLRGDTVSVRLRVAAPSWVRPRRALVFLNGQCVAERAVYTRAPQRPTDASLEFQLPRPAHDAYLVCVALGDGVAHPSWMTKEKFTMAVTNPVFLDADGDGRYSSPRDLAWAALQRAGSSPDQQWEAVAAADDVVAVQMLSLLRERWPADQQAGLENRIRAAGRPALRDYLEYPLPAVADDRQR
jgi:hypothetical protein